MAGMMVVMVIVMALSFFGPFQHGGMHGHSMVSADVPAHKVEQPAPDSAGNGDKQEVVLAGY